MHYEEIVRRQQEIVRQAVPQLSADRWSAELETRRTQTRRSASLLSHTKSLLPNGSQHTLPPAFPHPIFMERGAGSRVSDVDGNEYVDYILSGGAITLGHNHPELNLHVLELISKRTNFHGYFDEMELRAAERIVAHFPSIQKVRFTASGAEAVLAALRIARAFTRRTKCIKFRGSYHGWGAEVVTDVEVPGSERIACNGIPAQLLDQTVLVPQNDTAALEQAFAAHAHEGIAAVLCEAVGGESGLVPFRPGFQREAQEIAHHHGALFVLDEVVTGFRVGRGGVQRALGLSPDLTTLGKGLMNGYPGCGAVGGRAELLDCAGTGVPEHDRMAYIGGTLSGNVLSMTAAFHTIDILERTNGIERAIASADDAVSKLNALFSARRSSFFAYNFGSILRIEMTAPHAVPMDRSNRMEEVLERRGVLSRYMVPVHNRGVMSRMGRDMVSSAHDSKDNDRLVAAYDGLLDILR
jgi:glutamate-1-semialdehyde aminotransferase